MSISFTPARAAGAAGVCLALLASPAAAQSCIGSLGGPACNLSSSLALSTVSVGGSAGSMSQVFITVLGGQAMNSLQLFYTVGGVPQALTPAKPQGTLSWTPGSRVQLDGMFSAGSELRLGVLVNGSNMVNSGSAGGGTNAFREFGEGEVVYQDDRNTVLATGSGNSSSKVYGFEDKVMTGDRDYNDVVFRVDAVTVAPEPGTLLLVGGGLLGLGGVTLRRRRQQVAGA